MQSRRQVDAELISATARKEIDQVKKWLQQGANVNVRSGRGSENVTPLMIAAKNGSKNILTFLIASGADVNLQDDDGETALSQAIRWADHATVQVLLAHGAEPLPLHRAAIMGNIRLAQTLLAKENLVDVTDQNGCTPLLLAAFTGREAIVRLLLNHGAKVNHADKLGYTPLYQACRWGHLEVVRVLLSVGADVNARPKGTSFSALTTAQLYSHYEVVDQLKRAGAKE